MLNLLRIGVVALIALTGLGVFFSSAPKVAAQSDSVWVVISESVFPTKGGVGNDMVRNLVCKGGQASAQDYAAAIRAGQGPIISFNTKTAYAVPLSAAAAQYNAGLFSVGPNTLPPCVL